MLATGLISKIHLHLIDTEIIVIELNSFYIICEIFHAIPLINLCNLILIRANHYTIFKILKVQIFYVSSSLNYSQFISSTACAAHFSGDENIIHVVTSAPVWIVRVQIAVCSVSVPNKFSGSIAISIIACTSHVVSAIFQYFENYSLSIIWEAITFYHFWCLRFF